MVWNIVAGVFRQLSKKPMCSESYLWKLSQ